jgi:dihydrofolate reductase
MRKLIMWNLVTLDGFFEGLESWALDFHQTVWGEELERFSVEQLRTADLLFFGRVTYEGMAAYWQTAPPGEVADFMNRVYRRWSSPVPSSALTGRIRPWSRTMQPPRCKS